MRNKETQLGLIKRQIIEGLTLSSMQYFTHFKITRLSAHIHTLRHKFNIPIDSEIVHMKDELGNYEGHYTKYSINPSVFTGNVHKWEKDEIPGKMFSLSQIGIQVDYSDGTFVCQIKGLPETAVAVKGFDLFILATEELKKKIHELMLQ